MLHAFIDESGDEGVSGKSSPWLSLGGLIVLERDVHGSKSYLADGVGRIYTGKKVPAHVHFHKITSHSMRKALLQMLCGLNFNAIVVASRKDAFHPDALRDLKCPKLYNYMARYLLERISWYGRDRNLRVNVTFASRSEVPWDAFAEYVNKLRDQPTQIAFDYIAGLTNIPANTNSLVQSADWITSGVTCGLNPDECGDVETCYAEILWGKFWMRGKNLWSYGLKILPKTCDRKNERLFRKIDTWLEDPTFIAR
jgi:uncharacterized protein DUF3800